ncbi:sigma-70 family RNA polymerase sigma factor [Crenobacter sp. SG2303]|uniref:Sigma-70 family RNA polymerase sigma factor n=1 Tax=Crenobacter oryzisoli TaxID=3056844 RepID=A0ABT7XV02_9NEIS|nr:sigma-70 family RNA polymerase sigma factor [Crenobacter sp. SG2303]MDN0077364.1 sigma-70 family RNA polymerase sigma factor [Crenobacter sp. SG2303]
MDRHHPDVNEELIDLLTHTALDERKAFARLYQLAAPQLLGILLRHVRQRALAEELLQDCFIEIWDHAPDYRPERGMPLAWMGRIARNKAIDALWQSPNEASSAPPVLFDPGAGDEPLAVLSERSETSALSDCLRHLPAAQRQSVVLAYFYGQSHREIAGILGSPSGTVKGWITRAVAHLRECVGV